MSATGTVSWYKALWLRHHSYAKAQGLNFLGLFNPVNAKRAPGTKPAAAHDDAPNELTLALAKRLNAIKDERNLSQRRLAVLTGLSQAYMARVLKGDANIGLGMLLVIARALGEEPAILISPIKED